MLDQPKKFLILTQLFTPEHGAGAIRLDNTAKQLIELGHKVQVIAPTPNYPLGKTYPGYKTWQLYKKEVRDNGIVIHRFPTYPATGKGFARLLNFVVFNASSLLAIFKIKEKPDYIFMNSGPLTLGVNALIFKFLWRSKLILFVADLWPKAVNTVNSPIKKLALKPLYYFERLMYKKSNTVLCATKSLKDHIESLDSSYHCSVSPNGVDVSFFDENLVTDEEIRNAKLKLNPTNKRLILYQGNHGYAHGIDNFIDVYAKADQSIKDTFKICFVGGGSAKEALIEQVRDLRFKKDEIEFFKPVKQKELRSLISVSDIGLITLADTSFARDSRPAKAYPMLSLNKPIFFVGEGEGLIVLAESKASTLLAKPSDQEEILNRINSLNSLLAEGTGNSTREYCFKNMDWKVIVKKWLNSIN